jgi:hypothetical protein
MTFDVPYLIPKFIVLINYGHTLLCTVHDFDVLYLVIGRINLVSIVLYWSFRSYDLVISKSFLIPPHGRGDVARLL